MLPSVPVPPPRRAVPRVSPGRGSQSPPTPTPTPTPDKDLARSGNPAPETEDHSVESPLLVESFTAATPSVPQPQPTRAQAPPARESFDSTRLNESLSLSPTYSQECFHPPKANLKTGPEENHSLLHLLDSKAAWSEGSDTTTAPDQETESELRQTSAGLRGWMRSLGRWFGHSKRASVIVPEVRIELADMLPIESPITPHTSGTYNPPWLSLVPLSPLEQSIVATLDFSAFDSITDEPFDRTFKSEQNAPN